MFCAEKHYLSECSKFLAQSFDQKKQFARQKGVCYGCLRRRHKVADCRYNNPALMQDGGPAASAPTSEEKPKKATDAEESSTPKVKSYNTHAAPGSRYSSMILPVRFGVDNPDGTKRYMTTFALLDTQSDGCFLSEESTPPQHTVHSSRARDVTPEEVRKAFDSGIDDEGNGKKGWSVQDHKFIDIMKENARITENGMIELPLPFIKIPDYLPPSCAVAIRRLMTLKRKFLKDKEYMDKYVEFVQAMILKGYAEKVPEEDMKKALVWYLPHHGVFHPRKPGKLRVVFNPSAEIGGITLNKLLLQGPDLTNNLAGVLMRFREELIAVECDVESMFYRVLVATGFRDFMRFVWFRNGDVTQDVVDFRMTSSPGCANFALKMIADMHEGKFGPAAAEFLRRYFYVDDGLRSVPTVDHAISLVHSSHLMCKAGQMNLCKFSSNSETVVAAIPEELRSKELQNLRIGTDDLPTEPTLGMGWCQSSDCLTFLANFKPTGNTRRQYLSSLSSVFDPLGLVGPVLLIGRQLLQELCLQEFTWDQEITGGIQDRWNEWFSQLADLNSLRIPRCMRRDVLLPIARVILHVFTDASLSGYGACCYAQLVDNASSDVTLVYAKSRVAPTRRVSVPPLELQAAVLGVKMGNFVAEELSYPSIELRYWSDSQVVLAYILNESRRFHTFVGNRVSFIRENSMITSWGYVSTENNPADLTSRGATVSALASSPIWWTGPVFLVNFPNEAVEVPSCNLDPEDPEVKRAITTMDTAIRPRDVFSQLADRCSDWNRVLRSVAWFLKFKHYVMHKAGVLSSPPDAIINVGTVFIAQMEVLRRVQREAFPEEYTLLNGYGYPENRADARSRNQQIKRSSNLYRLDPFVGSDGVMRVGGRVRRAHLSDELKHPVILPRNHRVTSMLIAHHHRQVQHAGRGTTLAALRSHRYWILGGRSAVGSAIAACVQCRRLRSPPAVQMLADLPEDRLEPGPAFTHAAVDFFGPFYTRRARSELKRYGCIFVCQSSRAVHLEMACSLTTDDFLLCYRRFVCRRGPVRTLRCDQGTNFVGARNELATALHEMNSASVGRALLAEQCDWIDFRFNPPHASHMGGSWERLIRTTRSALSALLAQHRAKLSDSELMTFMAEAENIVNSRPLYPVDDSDAALAAPITPFSLLTLKDRVLAPLPGVFQPADVYARRRWRTIQYLATQFWSKWKSDFLPTLQPRRRFVPEAPNMKEGDIVLLVDQNVPRSQWSLGRVIEVIPSDDGLVRTVKVKTSTTELVRPIARLVLLLDL